MKHFSSFILLFLLFTTAAAILYAEENKSGYVSDVLILTVREGPGKEFEVIKTIKSDTPVEIVERKNSYFKIRLKNGTEGWVANQYITFDTPDHVTIEKLKQKIKTLSRANEALDRKVSLLKEKNSTRLINMEREKDTLNRSLEQSAARQEKLKQELSRVRKEYNDLLKKSENILALIEENKRLQKRDKELSGKVEKLVKENDHLLKTGMIKWFLAGAGILLSGVIIGRGLSSRKRRSGGLIG